MKIKIILFLMLFSISSCKVLEDFALKPTNLETVSALKEVLNSSTFRAIKTLKNLNDQGVEGIFPAELSGILSTLKTAGLSGEVDNVTKEISNVSGIVLDETQIVMQDAIKQLSFKDAAAVVIGGEDAATQVLREAMYVSVKNRYSLMMDDQLSQTDVPKYWPIATTAYNLFSENKIETSLPDFLAETAVDALFLAMGKEEKNIRTDYTSLGKAVVTKVFDYYTKN